jgi:hypothetical protein
VAAEATVLPSISSLRRQIALNGLPLNLFFGYHIFKRACSKNPFFQFLKNIDMTISKMIISFLAFIFVQTAALAAAFEGEYKGVSGKIGIYKMNSMTIAKNSDNDKYTVKFGGDRDITYKSSALLNNKIQINDKGWMMYITLNGDKATVDPDGAIFQRLKK